MKLRRGLILLLLALGSAAFMAAAPMPAMAQTQVADVPLPDANLEARARRLMKDVRCVVCQAQSIDESDAGIAGDMRRLIREEIAAGRSDDEIRQYLADRYGDFVLFKPPFKTTTALLWAGPFLLLGFGGLVIFLFFRHRTPPTEAGLSAEDLRRVAAALDAEGLPEQEDGATTTRPGSGA
ncbi:cytochrome c-type biogenesis protein CcmH [Dongia sp.]|uniref:cytochrome c-type biogenesis protein n=1 Tax=Dongia sp. TaxID=1977262 RepID=UPI0035B02E32